MNNLLEFIIIFFITKSVTLGLTGGLGCPVEPGMTLLRSLVLDFAADGGDGTRYGGALVIIMLGEVIFHSNGT